MPLADLIVIPNCRVPIVAGEGDALGPHPTGRVRVELFLVRAPIVSELDLPGDRPRIAFPDSGVERIGGMAVGAEPAQREAGVPEVIRLLPELRGVGVDAGEVIPVALFEYAGTDIDRPSAGHA